MRPFEDHLEAERHVGHDFQAGPIANPPRPSPGPMQHDVWRVIQPDDDGAVVLEQVNASDKPVTVQARGMAGRREAVRKATEKLPEDEQYGTFVTVKHGEMSAPITREKKLEPTDVWS